MKRKNLQPIILYPAKLSFRIEGKIKSLPDKQKLKESIATKLALQQMLKEFPQVERYSVQMETKRE